MSQHYPGVPPRAPAGWYPIGNGQQRYWNGEQWTGHVGSPPPAAGPGPQAVAPYAPTPYAPTPYPPGPYPAAPYGYGRYAAPVSPKSPGLALLASFFIPGLGQFLNGDNTKGALLLIGYLVSLVSIMVLVGLLLVPAIWIFAMVDAYTSANAWNAAHGVVG